jgi:tetratricopeptide (TPR) repeat protein
MFVNCLVLFSRGILCTLTANHSWLGQWGDSHVDRLTELRALYQERQLAEARALYEGQPGYTDPEWYWLGSLMYWHLEEYPLSRWAADYGLSLRPEGEMRVKLLQRLGTTEERLGDFRDAIMHLESCLAELPAYPSLAAIMKGSVLYNIALAFYNRSPDPADVQTSIRFYQQAAEEFRREGMREHLCMCLHNLAWALCESRKQSALPTYSMKRRRSA